MSFRIWGRYVNNTDVYISTSIWIDKDMDSDDGIRDAVEMYGCQNVRIIIRIDHNEMFSNYILKYPASLPVSVFPNGRN